MKLVLQVKGPLLSVEAWAAAIPIVLGRLREIGFDSTGTAIVEGARADRLRLVDGRAGKIGAAYQLDDAEQTGSQPSMGGVGIVLTADDRTRTAIEAHGTASADPMALTLELTNPQRPTQLTGVATMAMVDLPKVLGASVEIAGQLNLDRFHANTGPQLRFTISSRLIAGVGTVHLRPLRDPGYKVTIIVKPRRLARLLVVVWPFVRKQFIAMAEKQYGEVLADIQRNQGGELGPHEIADRVWREIVSDLTGTELPD